MVKSSSVNIWTILTIVKSIKNDVFTKKLISIFVGLTLIRALAINGKM